MTVTDDRNSSPQEIEREAEASRRRLSSTLDELRDNLTPSHVVEELMDNARDGGASMLRALGKAARANPIPALLIGTGCVMYLMGGAGSGSTASSPLRGARTATRARPEGAGSESMTSGVDGLAQSARESAGAAMEGVGAGLSSARESVAGAASEIGERARRVVEGVTETTQAYSGVALDAARETGERLKANVSETVHRSSEKMRENVATMLHEQPLVLGALGVAIGAAIGAMLPRTQAEDRVLGSTADAVKDAAARVAEEQYERARETASQVVEEVREAAAEHGLTPEHASEVVDELGRKVKQAAGMEDPANEGGGRMQQAAGQQRQGPGSADQMQGRQMQGRQMQGGGPGDGRQMQGSSGQPLPAVEVTPTSTRE